jgi:hypothetical protein
VSAPASLKIRRSTRARRNSVARRAFVGVGRLQNAGRKNPGIPGGRDYPITFSEGRRMPDGVAEIVGVRAGPMPGFPCIGIFGSASACSNLMVKKMRVNGYVVYSHYSPAGAGRMLEWS